MFKRIQNDYWTMKMDSLVSTNNTVTDDKQNEQQQFSPKNGFIQSKRVGSVRTAMAPPTTTGHTLSKKGLRSKPVTRPNPLKGNLFRLGLPYPPKTDLFGPRR
jgi:hypothetical protein